MRQRQLGAAVAAGVVVLAGGSVAYAHTQGGSGSYRTATVTVGDVDRTLALSGTVTAAARRDLSFGAAGTVKTITVAAGDSVSSGDALATLDPTALDAAVVKAEATLARAKATLETDQSSQASTVTDAATSSSTSTPGTSTPSSTSTATAPSDKTSSKTSKALAAALKKLVAQQAAVTSAQTAATDAISSAQSALALQQDACKVAEAPASDDDADDDASAASGGDPAATDVPDECATALDDVQSAQAVVSDKQDALQEALQDLSATLTSAVKGVGGATASSSTSTRTDSTGGTSGGSSGTSSSSGSSASGSASGAGTSTGAGSGGGTVTAATLAKDQAAIDTAAAQLTEARRELASATLTAPFGGEILSVSVAKGDTVGASDVAVVIAGDGGTTVTTTVTLDQVDAVKAGQAAVMTPAGGSTTVAGTVSAIGMLPGTTTDSTTATYPVTIDVDSVDTDVAAPEGSAVSIQLVVGTTEKAVTVPSSAVSTTGRSTVTLLTDGRTVVTPVTVGVVGASRTSVTDGLKEGQVVVIADLDAALPSGDSASTRLPGVGGGGMPSGAGGPGGRRS